jgi:hypothetical protein
MALSDARLAEIQTMCDLAVEGTFPAVEGRELVAEARRLRAIERVAREDYPPFVAIDLERIEHAKTISRLRGLLRDLVDSARSFDVTHQPVGDQDAGDEHVGWLVADEAFEMVRGEVASMAPPKGDER